MASIPSDIWHEITSFLLYSDFQALLACGSYALSAKIVQSAKKVEAEVEIFDKFPFSAFNLPRIENLTIKRMHSIPDCVLRLNGASILPSKPVITLKSLELDFAQSLSILAHNNPSFSPFTLFPNLTSLRLSDCIGLITPSMLQSLPAGLEILHINPSLSGPKSAFKSSFFQYLPRGLQYLHLNRVEITVEAGEMRFLPQSLKRLYLRFLVESSRESIGEMPPLLEELDLSYKSGNGSASTRFPVSILPSSLRRIECDGVTFTLESPLPPHIEEFTASMDFGALSEAALFAYFPKSLTRIPHRLASDFLLQDRLAERFSRLTSLYLPSSVPQPHLEMLFSQGFPPALNMLLASFVQPSPGSTIQLPATLTRLQCYPAAAWLQNLPTSLKYLFLVNLPLPEPMSALKLSDWNRLPSGLRQLSCCGEMLGPPENLPLLHRLSALKSLSITSLQPKWLEGPSVSLKWPQTLEHMEIGGAEMSNMEWLSSLSSLTHLKALSLEGKFYPSTQSSHLDKLPRGLHSMRMRWIPKEGFSGLPNSLIALSISLYAEDLSLTTMNGLPPKLQSLEIFRGGNRKMLELDPNDILPLLPVGLSRIEVSCLDDPEGKAMLQRYYSHPRWENLMT